jgi:peroxiredoxin Q/BCP
MPLEVGRKAPAFALADENGDEVKLADFEGRRLVVFFYPKANTSG